MSKSNRVLHVFFDGLTAQRPLTESARWFYVAVVATVLAPLGYATWFMASGILNFAFARLPADAIDLRTEFPLVNLATIFGPTLLYIGQEAFDTIRSAARRA